MHLYVTTIKAISSSDGELHSYIGPNVPGISVKTAQEYCENNGLGYCKVDGILVSEIPCKKGTYEPDWENKIEYGEILN